MFAHTLLIVLLLPPLLTKAIVHPIHVSVTEVEFDRKEKELEIMVRIFLDDLETAVRNQRKKPNLDILNPGKGLTTEALVADYLRQHFDIHLDQSKQAFRYLGHEAEGLALICYISVENVGQWASITITNSVLHELYDDQSNLVHVTVDGKIKSARLVKNKNNETFSFEAD